MVNHNLSGTSSSSCSKDDLHNIAFSITAQNIPGIIPFTNWSNQIKQYQLAMLSLIVLPIYILI